MGDILITDDERDIRELIFGDAAGNPLSSGRNRASSCPAGAGPSGGCGAGRFLWQLSQLRLPLFTVTGPAGTNDTFRFFRELFLRLFCGR